MKTAEKVLLWKIKHFTAHAFCVCNFLNDPENILKFSDFIFLITNIKIEFLFCFVFDKNSNICFLHFFFFLKKTQMTKKQNQELDLLSTWILQNIKPWVYLNSLKDP